MRNLKTIGVILSLALALVAFISLPTGHAQKTSSATSARPFEPVEELHFEAEFSRALIRKLDVADIKFRAANQPDGDSYALTFNAEVKSKGFLTRLFNLNFNEVVEFDDENFHYRAHVPPK